MSAPEILKRTVRAFRDYLPFYTRQALMRQGLIATRSDCTPFVIIATARTGTNMLRSLLNDHGQIRAYGEIFRRRGRVGWDVPFHPRGGAPGRLIERDPVAFLERYLYGIQPAAVHAVGFKLFYEHAQTGNWTQVWDDLGRRRDIRVIHLKRENVLKTYLSLVKAHQSGVWESTRGGDANRSPIHLDPEKCQTYFINTRANEAHEDQRFSRHPLLQLCYEELAADREGTMHGVFEFLGLPQRPARPTIRKQGNRPLRESIRNYDELKACFAGSEWEVFFRD